MKEGQRKAFRIVGIILMAAAFCAMGYAAWNLISAEINTRNSLLEAEQIIEEMNAYTGSPEAGTDTGTGTGTQSDPTEVNSADPGLLDPDPPASQDALGSEAPASSPGPSGQASTGASVVKATAKPNTGSDKKPAYFGILIFDTLGNRKVPILEGVTEQNLNRGAVHHPRSSRAGNAGNCVIYGHRNTVFRSFGRLKTGDTVRLEIPGSVLTYHITSTAIVEPDDPVIFKAYGGKVMTLVTCYPFNYTGSAPQRYIVVCTME